MKRTAFALMVFLAMSSIAFASVAELKLTDLGSAGAGLKHYTLSVEGLVGVETLSTFQIGTPVNQVFGNTGAPDFLTIQSEWLGNGSATESEVADTYVIFGDLRIPDLNAGGTPGVDFITLETVTGGGSSGMGTLNNYDDSVTPTWDAYLRTGEPDTTGDPVDLMHLVLSDTLDPINTVEDLDLTLTLFTATDYNSETGQSIVTGYDFTYGIPIQLPGEYEQGDCDGDGDIDGDDFLLFSSGWFGPDGADPVNTTPDAAWGTGDFDDDGDIDGDDFLLFAGHGDPDGVGWFGPNGSGYEGGVAVPEPSTIVMLILGAFCLIGYRLRK